MVNSCECSGTELVNGGSVYRKVVLTPVYLFPIFIYRVPKESSVRRQWIEIIQDVNNHDFNGCGYVCQYHFHPTELKQLSDRILLIDNAIPTIFNRFVEVSDMIGTKADVHENIAPVSKCTCHIKYQLERTKTDAYIHKLKNIIAEKSIDIKSLRKDVKRLEAEVSSRNELLTSLSNPKAPIVCCCSLIRTNV